jgi:hypothetical protein
VVLFYSNPTDLLQRRALERQATRVQQTELRLELDAVEKQQQAAEKTADANATQAAFQNLRTQIAVNKDVWSQLSGAFTGVLQQTFYSVLLFGLVGFGIGTVLDPVNKAVFLQFIPELGERAKDRGMVAYLTGYHLLSKAKQKLETKYTGHAMAQRLIGQGPLQLSARYYIGRGLITAAEYDDLTSQYYRFTEITIGMIVPSVILGAAVCFLLCESNDTRFPNAGIWALGLILVATIAVVLQWVGLRRYGEFRSQVFDLIAGRERAQEDQKGQVSRDEVVILARVLRRVEDVAGKLEHEVELVRATPRRGPARVEKPARNVERDERGQGGA